MDIWGIAEMYSIFLNAHCSVINILLLSHPFELFVSLLSLDVAHGAWRVGVWGFRKSIAFFWQAF